MAEVIQKVIDTKFNYTQLIGSSTFDLYTAPAGKVMALKELNVTSKNIEGNVSLKIGNVSVGTSGTNDTLEGTLLIVAGEKLVLDTTAYVIKPGAGTSIELSVRGVGVLVS